MKRLVGIVAAMIMASIAIFDIGKESKVVLGLGPVIILLVFGFVMWRLLSKLTKSRDGIANALPINSALWLHSLIEGGLAALSFSFGLKAGLIISGALVLHLLPEAFAAVTALKQIGYSNRYALRTYIISVGLLIVGFGLLMTVKISEYMLASLATLVAGGFIYLALNTFSRSVQNN